MKTTTNFINLKEHRANFEALDVLNLAWPRGLDLNFMSLLGRRSKLKRPLAVALNAARSFFASRSLRLIVAILNLRHPQSLVR